MRLREPASKHLAEGSLVRSEQVRDEGNSSAAPSRFENRKGVGVVNFRQWSNPMLGTSALYRTHHQHVVADPKRLGVYIKPETTGNAITLRYGLLWLKIVNQSLGVVFQQTTILQTTKLQAMPKQIRSP